MFELLGDFLGSGNQLHTLLDESFYRLMQAADRGFVRLHGQFQLMQAIGAFALLDTGIVACLRQFAALLVELATAVFQRRHRLGGLLQSLP